FYWGFGLPSYIFIVILVVVGLGLIRRLPLSAYWPKFRLWLLMLFMASVFLGFAASKAEFPWGGAFGKAVSEWLVSFVGTLGLIVLFFFLILGTIVWNINPNFNDMTVQGAFRDAKAYVNDWVTGRLPGRKQEEARREGVSALRPGERGGEDEEYEAESELLDRPASPGASQLAFDLANEEANQRKEFSRPGGAELEIQEGPLPSAVPSESSPVSPFTPPDLMPFQEENVDHSEPYDPTLELSSYEYPVVALLDDYSDQRVEIDRAELEANKDQIIETLLNYKIEITKIRATIGPTVTLYEIIPAPGVRISKIKNLEDDIALSLAALGIRIIAPIPGKGTIGIEVPNKKKQVVSMREVLMHEKFKRAKMDLPIALGKTISNEVFVADLAKMPHLLVAGATGQGKSVGVNAILMSLLYKKHPSQVKLVLVDPKKVELFPYSRLESHFLSFLPEQEEPITTETNRVIHTLNSLCIEMDQRYDLLKKASARNIREYNEKFVQRRLNPHKGHRFLPFIVLVIDEFADMIMTAGKEVELPIGRLAQLARAVGIHLI
ncbi:MAG: DNA translocase FtsK 4TM domain-containing protein, partial [Phaeodactylibacter sp.]|nr:DNA translocase FtsK 4TM domain-containing protein [Phaeodactylibacter sp.]